MMQNMRMLTFVSFGGEQGEVCAARGVLAVLGWYVLWATTYLLVVQEV